MDQDRGDLFYTLNEILVNHMEIKAFILENVRNLSDKEHYWKEIIDHLTILGFIVTESPIVVSPSDFGVPQIRERVYIVGIRKEYANNRITESGEISAKDLNLHRISPRREIGFRNILISKVDPRFYVDEETSRVLDAWDEFRDNIISGTMGFPIWIKSFGIGITDNSKYEDSIAFFLLCTSL